MVSLILKGLIGGLANAGLMAVLLLGFAKLAAGTWYWARAIVFLAVYAALAVGGSVLLAVKAPASFQVRVRWPVSRRQPAADRIITAILILYFLGWVAFMPIDVFRLKLLPAPAFAVSFCGGVLFLFGFVVMMAAVYQNSFAAPIVEDQTDRGQVLVDTGLYALVRHPMYLGGLAFFTGMPLWLGSYAALIAATGLAGIVIARILVEERTLRRTLPGYAEYIQRVRCRLIPFVW